MQHPPSGVDLPARQPRHEIDAEETRGVALHQQTVVGPPVKLAKALARLSIRSNRENSVKRLLKSAR
jgi:hypothetical protein